MAAEDFGFASDAPHNRSLWEEDFVALLEGVARKTLLAAGPAPDGRPRRFFVKGHFLAAAEALQRRWPDARFLTMIRPPGPRLRSAVNYLRVNPTHPALGPVPWAWWAEAALRAEIVYCEREQEWYTRDDGVRRCVIRFDDYRRDLEASMAQVYRTCLDLDPLPSHVPRTHAPRERTRYTLDRPLGALGIDADALDARLSSYVAWCRSDLPGEA